MSENEKPTPRTAEEALAKRGDTAIPVAPETEQPQLLFVLDGIRYESVKVLEVRGSGEKLMLAQRRLPQGPAGYVAIRSVRGPSRFLQRQRLVDEVRLAFLLHHPAIARVYHLTIHQGAPHIIMEYVDGPSLDTVLTLMAMRGQAVSPSFALYVASEVAGALHHAHTLEDGKGRVLGIIHRDVSPRNICLDAHGAVKLTHFGAAYSLMVGREETPELLLKGDVAYAAPEYVERSPLTPASDVFSLGLVLLELLTGRHLFNVEEEGAVQSLVQRSRAREPKPEEAPSLPFALMRRRMAYYTPADVERAVEGQPEPLKAILHKALERAPSARYATAAGLRDAMQAALAQMPGPYGRKEAREEAARLISEAGAQQERVELLQEGIFPGNLEERELSTGHRQV